VSVAVPLGDLREQILGFVVGTYLVTVGPDRIPRTTSVSVSWEGELLVAPVGARTAANVHANRAATLLWPALVLGQYALIVDGLAEVRATSNASPHVLIRPHKAVLHVTRSHGEERTRATDLSS
jgi:hypothetical protein